MAEALQGRAMPKCCARKERLVECLLGWVVTSAVKWGGLIAASIIDWGYFFLMRRPRVLRTVAGVGRRWLPVLPLGRHKLVFRAEDVHEVLERNDDFLLSPINERKLRSGDFIISLDPGAQYLEEKALIRAAFPPDRSDRLFRIATAATEKSLEGAPDAGKLDLVPLAERVTVEIVSKFWGLDPSNARSRVVRVPWGAGTDKGPETMRLWLRKLAALIASRDPAPFGVMEVGHACGEEYVRYVKEACEKRAAAPPASEPDDVLGRIVWHAPRTEQAWRAAAGLIVTGTTVVTKAFTHAFEQLIGNPEALNRAIDAAKADDRQALERFMMEALRFNTVFPMLARYCPRNTTLARGTPRETEIPADSMVAVSPTAAMFDPLVVEEPDEFREHRELNFNPDWSSGPGGYRIDADYRPLRDMDYSARMWRGIYMHFGSGAHWCPADEMALAAISAMCGAVLRRLPDPRIAAWLPELLYRPLRYDGPAVWRLKVHYG
jgi:cytochrome P450